MNTENIQDEYWLNLIIDSLTNTISVDKQQELDEWLASSASNRAYFHEMEILWKSLSVVQSENQFDSQAAYTLFENRVKEVKKRKKTVLRLSIVAAVLVPFLFLGYFTYSHLTKPNTNSNYVSKIRVPDGSKSEIELKDGTKVFLNSGSSIEIDADFGKQERRIRLYGEAYLDVSPNSACPFIVATDGLSIKVLGTSFNVNTYIETGVIRVALLEGSVELLPDTGPTVVMKPNDLGIYNTQSKMISVKENAIKDAFAWKHNALIFNGEQFEDIVRILERNFNVKINIHKQSMRSQRFVGDFVNLETIEQIMEIMSTNKQFRYTIKGNLIDIY